MALTALGVGLSAIGVGSSIFGSVAQSNAAKKAARQAKKDAKFIKKLGPKEAAEIIRQGSRLVGEQRVAFSGSGVDVTSGTPLDVMAEAIADSELNALRAIQTRNQEAKSIRRGGQAAASIGRSNAIGTILGGASQAVQTVGLFARGQ